jgi:hypothetical protein
MAQGDANKLWIIPSEVSDAIKGVGGAFQSMAAPKIPGAPGPADAAVTAANGNPGVERRTERPELDPE